MQERQQSTGIILKVDSRIKEKVTIFDKNLGKLKIYLPDSKNLSHLCNGAIVDYNIYNIGFNPKIRDINVIDVPFSIACKNILFFHHVLELCYYFIPTDITSFEVFELIYYIFSSFDKLENLQLQKLILGRFFLLLGIYPEDIIIKPYLHYLLTMPIDNINNITIDLKSDKELSLWILQCINMHPYAKSFKTKHFLTSVAIS